MSMALKPALAALAEGRALSDAELDQAFATILEGDATPAQIAGFLMGLKIPGEGPREVAAAARALRARMVALAPPFETIDVCGTGGDGAHTLNISTAVAFVVAGAGLKVAKHGNRAMSSRTGTADVLEALGVDIAAGPDRQLHALEKAGLCFLFAQAHHTGMRHAAPVRREIGVRTVFNLAGPLSNPAGARRQLVGVSDPRFLSPMAEALKALGAAAAWVAHGAGGLDELSLAGPSEVVALDETGALRQFSVTPEEAGLARAPVAALAGGDAAENAAALKALLAGAPGPYRDAVALNAAAAFIVAGRAQSLAEGARLAEQTIDAGHAATALARLVAVAGRA